MPGLKIAIPLDSEASLFGFDVAGAILLIDDRISSVPAKVAPLSVAEAGALIDSLSQAVAQSEQPGGAR